MTIPRSCAVVLFALAIASTSTAQAKPPAAATSTVRVNARVPAGPATPVWDKGIQPIGRASYWNAVECGKQKGSRPLCVFPDADLCKNGDYTLALFTPYKQVAYEVWADVRQGHEPPTPSYADAQRTRVTIGVTPVSGAANPITALTIRRAGQVLKPATQSLDGSGGGRFIFDYAPFAPTSAITIEMSGRARTISCVVDVPVLKTLR